MAATADPSLTTPSDFIEKKSLIWLLLAVHTDRGYVGPDYHVEICKYIAQYTKLYYPDITYYNEGEQVLHRRLQELDVVGIVLAILTSEVTGMTSIDSPIVSLNWETNSEAGDKLTPVIDVTGLVRSGELEAFECGGDRETRVYVSTGESSHDYAANVLHVTVGMDDIIRCEADVPFASHADYAAAASENNDEYPYATNGALLQPFIAFCVNPDSVPEKVSSLDPALKLLVCRCQWSHYTEEIFKGFLVVHLFDAARVYRNDNDTEVTVTPELQLKSDNDETPAVYPDLVLHVWNGDQKIESAVILELKSISILYVDNIATQEETVGFKRSTKKYKTIYKQWKDFALNRCDQSDLTYRERVEYANPRNCAKAVSGNTLLSHIEKKRSLLSSVRASVFMDGERQVEQLEGYVDYVHENQSTLQRHRYQELYERVPVVSAPVVSVHSSIVWRMTDSADTECYSKLLNTRCTARGAD